MTNEEIEIDRQIGWQYKRMRLRERQLGSKRERERERQLGSKRE